MSALRRYRTKETRGPGRKREDGCAGTRKAATWHCDAACPPAPLPGGLANAAAPTPQGNNSAENKENRGRRSSPALGAGPACAGGGRAYQALSMSTRVLTLVALLVLVRTPTFWPVLDLLLPVLNTRWRRL